MVTWGQLRELAPELADAGRRMLYQYGEVGLAFLGTVTRAGDPRVHPVCPVVTYEGLYVLVVPSPKREDLLRGSSFALHTFPAEDNEDAFYVTGRARRIDDVDTGRRIQSQFLAERGWRMLPAGSSDQMPFELDIDRILLTRTEGHGDPAPRHRTWCAP
jgi:hypothetical protein